MRRVGELVGLVVCWGVVFEGCSLKSILKYLISLWLVDRKV